MGLPDRESRYGLIPARHRWPISTGTPAPEALSFPNKFAG